MDQQPNNKLPGGPENQGPPNNSKRTILIVLVCLLISLLFMSFFSNMMNHSTSQEITYDQFIEQVEKGAIKEVIIEGSTLTIVPKEQPYQNFEITYSTYLVGDENNLSDLLEEYGVSFYKNPPNQTSTLVWSILSMLIPFALLIIGANIIMRHMSKGGGMMGVGKSKAKAYVQKETGVTFEGISAGSRGFSAQSGKVYCHRSKASQGRASGGTARNR